MSLIGSHKDFEIICQDIEEIYKCAFNEGFFIKVDCLWVVLCESRRKSYQKGQN